MDKYEYRIRAEEINSLIEQKEYAEAVKIADTIDWRRVRSVVMLCKVSELYKINRRYEDSKEVLLLAYDLQPGSRKIIYSLCELSIKLEETVQAVEYYKEFVQVAPRDTGKFILQYRLYEAQDVSLEERIAVLEEFKKRDYREKWAYELAYLYHRIGLATRCVEECDELILWFGEGKYVLKAMELKMLHAPLTPQQQEKYNARFMSEMEAIATVENQENKEHEDVAPSLPIEIKSIQAAKAKTAKIPAKKIQKETAAGTKKSKDMLVGQLDAMLKAGKEKTEQVTASMEDVRKNFPTTSFGENTGIFRSTKPFERIKIFENKKNVEDAEDLESIEAQNTEISENAEDKLGAQTEDTFRAADEEDADMKIVKSLNDLDIHIKPIDVNNEYSTINLQEALAKDLARLFAEEDMGATDATRALPVDSLAAASDILSQKEEQKAVYPEVTKEVEVFYSDGTEEDKKEEEAVYPVEETEVIYSDGAPEDKEDSAYSMEETEEASYPVKETEIIYSDGTPENEEEAAYSMEETPEDKKEASYPVEETEIIYSDGTPEDKGETVYSMEETEVIYSDETPEDKEKSAYSVEETEVIYSDGTPEEKEESAYSIEETAADLLIGEEINQNNKNFDDTIEEEYADKEEASAEENDVENNVEENGIIETVVNEYHMEENGAEKALKKELEPLIFSNNMSLPDALVQAMQVVAIEAAKEAAKETASAIQAMRPEIQNENSSIGKVVTPQKDDPQEKTVEKQITGQLSFADLLDEWEKTKKANEEKYLEETKQRVLEKTGPIFSNFDSMIMTGSQDDLTMLSPMLDVFSETEELANEVQKALNEEMQKEISENAKAPAANLISEITGRNPESAITANEFMGQNPESAITANEFKGQNPESAITANEIIEQNPESVITANEFIGQNPESALIANEFKGQNPENAITANEFIGQNPESAITANEFKGQNPESAITANEFMEQNPESAITANESIIQDLEGALIVNEFIMRQAKMEGTAGDMAIRTDLTDDNQDVMFDGSGAVSGSSGAEISGDGLNAADNIQESESAGGSSDVINHNSDASTSRFDTAEIKGLEEKLLMAVTGQHYNTSQLQVAILSEELAANEENGAKQADVEQAAVLSGEPRFLTKTEKEFFGSIAQTKQLQQSLAASLDRLSMTPAVGNLIVTGEKGVGTLEIALNIADYLSRERSSFTGEIETYTPESLQKRDISTVLNEIGSGAMIIDRAGDLTPQTCVALTNALQNMTGRGMIVILTDTKPDIERLQRGFAGLYQYFTVSIDITSLDNDGLVNFGKEYAKQHDYSIDAMGVLALYNRIEERQTIDHTVTVEEVRQIVDKAIQSASKKNMSHFMDIIFAKRYDKEDMIVLREKDFLNEK